MITTCTECQARYKLDATKVPNRLIKVRCPSCAGIFSLDGAQKAAVEPEPTDVPSATLDNSFGDIDSFAAKPPPPVDPVVAVAASTVASLDTSPLDKAGVAVLEDTSGEAAPNRRRRPKEEMLARALVSDILVYNRDRRDESLANGTLLEALGGEIKKSWELYKEKVTPEVANSSNHFRDALNDILAEGDKIF